MLPESDARETLEKYTDLSVLVIGDLILDHYLGGRVERISPEAPVPVVSVEGDRESWVPGGAANVVRNILSLGADASLAGVIGDDRPGQRLIDLLAEAGADTSMVIRDSSRPTSVKTRIMAQSQQLLRLDNESVDPVAPSIAGEMSEMLAASIQQYDVILFEDYDKGAITPDIITETIRFCGEAGRPVAVDPKFRNFFSYKGCNLFKPNRREVERSLGVPVRTAEEVLASGEAVRNRLQAQAVLITMGGEGSILCEKDRQPYHLPTAARHVYDVSGAGDTVIAIMALSLASGLDLRDGAKIANFAAAAVCAEPGVYAVTPGDILAEMESHATRQSADRS